MRSNVEPSPSGRVLPRQSPRPKSMPCCQEAEHLVDGDCEAQSDDNLRLRWPALDVGSPRLAQQARSYKLKFMR